METQGALKPYGQLNNMLPVGIYRACRFSDMSGAGGRGIYPNRLSPSRRDIDISDYKASKKAYLCFHRGRGQFPLVQKVTVTFSSNFSFFF